MNLSSKVSKESLRLIPHRPRHSRLEAEARGSQPYKLGAKRSAAQLRACLSTESLLGEGRTFTNIFHRASFSRLLALI